MVTNTSKAIISLSIYLISTLRLCKRGWIRFLEKAQGTYVQALINRITQYGSRRLEDLDKYEAFRLAEELVSVAKTTGDSRAASYDIIATTLREKIHVPKEQFKAYFLALLVDKEFTRIFDTISKVDTSCTILTYTGQRYSEVFAFQPTSNLL